MVVMAAGAAGATADAAGLAVNGLLATAGVVTGAAAAGLAAAGGLAWSNVDSEVPVGAGALGGATGAVSAAGAAGEAACIGKPEKGLTITGCCANTPGAIKTTLGANRLAMAILRSMGEGCFFIVIYGNSEGRGCFWRW